VFLGNYLIGLREGLEAALVVSILIAYIVKRGDRRALAPVWAGVGFAIALSIGFAYGLHLLVAEEDHFKVQELTGGILSLIAVGLVTWMVFWMRGAARGIKAELEGKLAAAIDMGAGALFVVAFLSVGREGLETALFLGNNINHSIGSPVVPVTGAICGLLLAPPIEIHVQPGGVSRTEFTLSDVYEGPPGFVHGGISALILDDLLGNAAAANGTPGMTATLDLRYRRPTPLGVPLVAEARTIRVEGRKTFVHATITNPEGQITIEATAMFVMPIR
jgi:acyl-coenzyme A thioesterase PaaI-like protein